MDHAALLRRLAKANRHVATDALIVIRHRREVDDLLLTGGDVSNAQRILVKYEDHLSFQIINRDRLRKQLGEFVA